jgi:hypothetical protein
LSKFGFPTPSNVPTEVEEGMLILHNEDKIARQQRVLKSLNLSHPNNAEQQNAYNNSLNSIHEFRTTEQDLLTSH